jgi:hypothetical protein
MSNKPLHTDEVELMFQKADWWIVEETPPMANRVVEYLNQKSNRY